MRGGMLRYVASCLTPLLARKTELTSVTRASGATDTGDTPCVALNTSRLRSVTLLPSTCIVELEQSRSSSP